MSQRRKSRTTAVDQRAHVEQLRTMKLSQLQLHLPKTTFNRLQNIAKRIKSILLTRAICICWVSLLVLTLIAVLLDLAFVLSSQSRWIIAVIIYGITALLGAWSIWPKLRLLDSAPWLAQVVESAVPQVRNRLLSALDLAAAPLLIKPSLAGSVDLSNGRSSSASRRGSIEFIDAFQMQVAGRMESVAPHHVLRWNAIRRWLIGAALGLVVVIVLLAIPSLSFAKRVARVWFPSANVGRVAAYELIVEEPSKPWIEVENDLFAVYARSLVGSPGKLDLEVSTSDGTVQKFAMQATPDDERRFMQNVALEGPVAKVRVLASDSSSAWYSIELVKRPSLTPKTVKLQFPDYAGIEPVVVEQWNGTIDCVSGTKVTTTFTSNEILETSNLVFQEEHDVRDESANQTLKTPANVVLLSRGNQNFSASFDVWTSGRYTLDAVDKRTKKNSDTNKTYSIDARKDRSPQLTWQTERPSRARFIAAHELTPLRLSYTDEFPLLRASVEYSIDKADWVRVDVPVPESATGELGWVIDPLALGVKDTQLLEVRFVAIDRKNQITQSEPTQWLVNNSYTPADRWGLLQKRFEIIQPLRRLVASWDAWMKQSDEVWQKEQAGTLEHLRTLPTEDETIETLAKSIQEIIEQSDEIVEQDAMIDIYLNLLKVQHLQIVRLRSEVASQTTSAHRDELAKLRNEAREISRTFFLLEKAAYQLFGEDLLLAANQDMTSIIDSQRALSQTAADLPPLQIRDRQAAIGGVLESLIEKLLKYSKAFPEAEQSSFALQLRNLRQTQASISSITGRSLLQKNAYWSTAEALRWIEQVHQQLMQYSRLHTMVDNYFNQHRENRKSTSPNLATWHDPLVGLVEKYGKSRTVAMRRKRLNSSLKRSVM